MSSYRQTRGMTAVAGSTFVCRVQCPFSKKAYATLRKQVVPHYKDKSFRFIFYHQVQP